MRNPMPFPQDARVLFIGDSITCNGTFVAHIQQYYRDNFPEKRVKCYNAGVSGGSVWGSALRYFDADIELFKPTHAVVMIGMNDIWRGHYMNEQEHYTDIKTERNNIYFDGVALLAEKLYALGIPVIFCTPSPFDDEMACETPAGKNLAMALTGYGHYCIGLAEKYGAGVVDFNSAKDPAFSLCGADRVHPTDALGHSVMALIFLRAQGFTDLPEPTVENYEKGLLVLTKSEDNEKRHAAERNARDIRTGAFFCLGDKWSAPLEERIALAQAYVDANKDAPGANPYVVLRVEKYIENVSKEEAYKAELMKLTDALYD